jgi:hypothetical protein
MSDQGNPVFSTKIVCRPGKNLWEICNEQICGALLLQKMKPCGFAAADVVESRGVLLFEVTPASSGRKHVSIGVRLLDGDLSNTELEGRVLRFSRVSCSMFYGYNPLHRSALGWRDEQRKTTKREAVYLFGEGEYK